jgi:OTU domain-containing protein 5
LGLSNYHPEEIDASAKQTKEACKISEQLEIEKMMVEDKKKITDWEATSDIVVEQIARQSYLQYCKDTLKQSTLTKSSTVTSDGACSSSAVDNDNACGSSSKHRCENNIESKENSVSLEFHKATKKSKESKRLRRSASRQYRNCGDQVLLDTNSNSPKRRRMTSANSSPSISSSDSDNEKPISMFYQSLLESSYSEDGK